MSARFADLDAEWEGAVVQFLGASKEQIQWGNNDDPNKVLTVGQTYSVEYADTHSWHTKIKLVDIDGVFNSASFELEKDD